MNTHSDDYGYHPGRRSFYNYPRHRHIDGGGEDVGSFGRPLHGSYDGSPNYDGNYGSPYYGTNYGAPYYGGGYYDGGVYYRSVGTKSPQWSVAVMAAMGGKRTLGRRPNLVVLPRSTS